MKTTVLLCGLVLMWSDPVWEGRTVDLGMPVEQTRRAARSQADSALDFLGGVWQVRARRRRPPPNGGWDEFVATLHVYRWRWGPRDGWREDWYSATQRAGIDHPVYGSAFRAWDPEREEWQSRLLDGQWTPFIFPEIGHFDHRGDTVGTQVTELSDVAGDYEGRTVFVREGFDRWRVASMRTPAPDQAFFVWQEAQAERINTTPERMGNVVVPWAEVEGTVETVWVGFAASRGLAIDDQNSVFLAASEPDVFSGDTVVVRVPKNGQREYLMETRGLAPTGLAWQNGTLFLKSRDTDPPRLMSVRNGLTETIARVPGDALAVTPSGDAYTFDFGSTTLHRVDSDGQVTSPLRDSIILGNLGASYVPRYKALFVADWGTGVIHRIGEDGVAVQHATVPGLGGANAAWMANDGAWLYVTGFGAHQIFRVSIQTPVRVEILAGNGLRGDADGDLRHASFFAPNGIAVSRDGRLIYVAELRALRSGLYPSGRLRRIQIR